KNDGDFVNGYADNVKDRAGTYTAKVALKVTDPAQYAFSDGSTEKVIEYTFTIDKATLDPSTIKWQYTDASGQTQIYDPTSDGVPWKGTNYTMTLTGLPAGVTVNPGNVYTGNQQKAVGTYTATCTSLKYDTNNYNAIASPTLSWTIKPAEVKIDNTSWLMDANSSSSGVFYLPHLNSPYDGTGIVYEYYHLGTDANPINPAEKLDDVSKIIVEFGTPHYYYVKAVLASGKSTDGVTDWQDALVFDDTTTQPNGACTMAFQTGDNRTPVSVTLNGNPVMYDGKEHGKLNEDLFIRVGSTDMSASDFHVDYYEYDENAANHMGDPIDTDAPVNAGKYLIVVSLSSAAEADYFLNATTFEFNILPYELDMSGVRWGYIDEEGNEIAYNPGTPPMYALADGTPFVYSMQLIGFPKGDENGTDEEKLAHQMFLESGIEGLFSYNNGHAQSAVGANYSAKYEYDAAGLSSNFVLVSMPTADDGLSETHGFKIVPREIAGPQNKTIVFSGEPNDLLELVGLNAEELGVYYEVSGFTTVDDKNQVVTLDPSDIETIVNAGVYRITCTLKDPSGDNVKWLVNGSLRTSAQTAIVTIEKLVVTVTDWDGEDGQDEPWTPIYNNGDGETQPPSGLIGYEIRDSRGELVEGNDWQERWNETFTQKLIPTRGNEGNVEIVYADGLDTEKTFTVGDDPSAFPAIGLDRPTFENGKSEPFSGSNIDFTPQGLDQYVKDGWLKLYEVDGEGNETAVGIDAFQKRNAGDYKIVARIDGNYKWKDTNDKSDMAFEFSISKAELTGTWETDESGMPVLKLAEGTPEAIANMLVYEYKDADGN
ncbi:MAG: hypothetical protein K2L87_04030, partial [Clostridiales bacterium]|nr:hypothetical protein [Clostridiales bacterium]